jgi:predicted TIM-barrel fold metal-dependent hydrolase
LTLIDSHFHVNFNGFSLTKTIEYLDKEGIDFCWLLSWEEINHGPWLYNFLSIDNIYEAYLKYPSRIIPFYAPDPHRGDATTQLQNWHQKGIRGCGELKATLSWNSDQIAVILKTVERLRMPVVFHMEESETRHILYTDVVSKRLQYVAPRRVNKKFYTIPRKIIQVMVNSFIPLNNRDKSYYFPGYMLDFSSLEVVLKDYPNVVFIGHGPLFWKRKPIESINTNKLLTQSPISYNSILWRLLSEYPNLYADISGNSGIDALMNNVEDSKKFLSTFETKILYGTDNTIKGQREFLNSLGLSKETYKNIYGENALRIINR